MINPGETVASYKVLRKVTEGQSSFVYEVEKDGQRFALKVLKASDETSLQQFRKESATLARLAHPNLIKIYDVGEAKGSPYLVMDFVDGETLDFAIAKAGFLPAAQCASIAIAVASALGELHKSNLVHRDVKPANILLSGDSQIKLIDLGLVGDIHEIQSETALVGTPLFCSPEQGKLLKRGTDFRSDLYSLGVTLFKCLTGGVPFDGSVVDILQQHFSTPAPDVRQLQKDADPGLAAIVAKLLSKDPDDRYQSTQGLIYDLERFTEISAAAANGSQPHLGAKDKTTRSALTKFVGYGELLKSLDDISSNLGSGPSPIVFVEGPAGSGKTRLCDEFAQKAGVKSERVLVLSSRCQASNKELPLSPFKEMIDSLFVETSPNMAKLLEAAKGAETQLGLVSRTFKRVTRASVVAADSGVGTEEAAQMFMNGLAQFFVNLCEHWEKVVMVFDDIQCIDESSLQLLTKINEAASSKKLMTVASLLSEAPEANTARIKSRLGTTRVIATRLEPMTREEVKALSISYLGAREIADEFVDALFARSKGNPSFTIELFRAGIDQGFITFGGGTWHLDSAKLQTVALSSNAYQLFLRRIDKGKPSEIRYLQFAAVYGTTFNAKEIAEVCGKALGELEVRAVLSTWRNLGVLEQISEERWRFSHEKIAEFLTSSLGAEESANVRLAVAKYYFDKASKSDEEIYTTARIFREIEGDRSNDAVVANTDAGLLASSKHAHGEAFVALKFAFDHCSDTHKDLKIKIAEQLLVSATFRMEWQVADQCSDFCIATARNREELGSHLVNRTWMLKVKCDYTPALEYFKRSAKALGVFQPDHLHLKLLSIAVLLSTTLVLEIVTSSFPFLRSLFARRKATDRDLKVVSLYRHGLFLFQISGRTTDFFLNSLKTYLMSFTVNDARIRALGYASAGFMFGQVGWSGLAAHLLDKSIASTPSEDPFTLAICESWRLAALSTCGLIDDPRKIFRERREFFMKHLDPQEFHKIFGVIFANISQQNGHNLEAYEEFVRYTDMIERGVLRLPPIILAQVLQHLIFNLSILFPRHSEYPALLKRYEEMMYSFRKSPSTYNLAAARRLYFSRYSQDVDASTFELMKSVGKGNQRLEYIRLLHKCNAASVRLLMLAAAKNPLEEFTYKHEFLKSVQNVSTLLFFPNVRCIYYYLMGAFYVVEKKYAAAESYFRKSEEIALKVDNLRILFEIARDRARSYRQQGKTHLMNAALLNASFMASKNGWRLAQELLSEEFGQELMALTPASADGPVSDSAHKSSSKSKNKSNIKSETIMRAGASSALRASRTQHVNDSELLGNSAIQSLGVFEQQRYIRALINMSAATANSLDPVEQSKAVLNQLISLFGAERGFVFVSDEESSEMSLVAGMSEQGKDLRTLQTFSKTVVKRVAETSKPLVVSGTDEAEAIGSESAVLYNLRSMMAAPLTNNGKLTGVVYLDSTLTKGLFAPGDGDLLAILSQQISSAFELSRMARVEMEKLNLQRELDVQTAIATESKKVKILVDNMQQALFAVDDSGSVVEPVSRFSTKLFNEDITGKKVLETLYRDMQNQGEKLEGIRSALNTVFGEDDLQWDFMKDHFPEKVRFAGSSEDESSERKLRINTSPIWDEQARLEKLLFVVEDVTEFERLESQIQSQREEAEMLQDVLASKFDDLRGFVGTARAEIAKARTLASALTAENMISLLRNLHTLKGNSRLFKIRKLSEQIHASETELVELQKHLGEEPEQQAEPQAKVERELDKISAVLERYGAILDKLVASAGGNASSGTIDLKAISELQRTLESFSSELPREKYEAAQTAVRRLYYKQPREIVGRFESMVRDLSEQLGKKVALETKGDGLIHPSHAELIQDCLLHLIRNSIDHGLETTDERTKAGKPAEGRIVVECSYRNRKTVLVIMDDGRGIDAERIASLALEKGLINEQQAKHMSKEEKLDLIFAPGFSSKDSVNDISGRGIGMNVVKENVESLGGHLLIQTEIGRGTSFVMEFAEADQTNEPSSALKAAG